MFTEQRRAAQEDGIRLQFPSDCLRFKHGCGRVLTQIAMGWPHVRYWLDVVRLEEDAVLHLQAKSP